MSQLELTNLEENEYKSNKSTDTSRKLKIYTDRCNDT